MIEFAGHWWPWVFRREAPENGFPQSVKYFSNDFVETIYL